MKLPKIERYNQVVFALIGTGAIIAIVGVIIIMLGVALSSLFRDSDKVQITLVDDQSSDIDGIEGAKYDYCRPISISDTPYQLIRVVSGGLVMRKRVEEKTVFKYGSVVNEFSGGERERCGYYNYSGTRDSTVVNVLVRNTETGAMQLALKQNAVIYKLETPPERENGSVYDSHFPPDGVLYWEVAFEDSNGDGVIDSRDDVGAYLSDIDGSDIKRLTPPLSRVMSKQYDENRAVLTMRVLLDTNHDSELDENDSQSLIESDVSERRFLGEILNRESVTEIMRTAEPLYKEAAK